jgi:hypothetical protein
MASICVQQPNTGPPQESICNDDEAPARAPTPNHPDSFLRGGGWCSHSRAGCMLASRRSVALRPRRLCHDPPAVRDLYEGGKAATSRWAPQQRPSTEHSQHSQHDCATSWRLRECHLASGGRAFAVPLTFPPNRRTTETMRMSQSLHRPENIPAGEIMESACRDNVQSAASTQLSDNFRDKCTSLLSGRTWTVFTRSTRRIHHTLSTQDPCIINTCDRTLPSADSPRTHDSTSAHRILPDMNEIFAWRRAVYDGGWVRRACRTPGGL